MKLSENKVNKKNNTTIQILKFCIKITTNESSDNNVLTYQNAQNICQTTGMLKDRMNNKVVFEKKI